MTYRSCLAHTLVVLLSTTVFSKADDFCTTLNTKLVTLDMKESSDLVSSRVGKRYQDLYAECDTANTFEGKPLPAFRGRPLKCSSDPNRVKFVRKFSDGTVVFRSKMGVDADGSPASKAQSASATDQPHTSLTYDGRPREFVNAEDVSFVVVPRTKGPYRSAFTADTGIGLGDLAVVMKDGRCSFGLVADEGPVFRIGEASLKTHEDLGNPQCKVPGEHPCLHVKAAGSGIGISQDVTFIVFPKTRPSPLQSATVSDVTAREGSRRVEAFLSRFQ